MRILKFDGNKLKPADSGRGREDSISENGSLSGRHVMVQWMTYWHVSEASSIC